MIKEQRSTRRVSGDRAREKSVGPHEEGGLFQEGSDQKGNMLQKDQKG